MRLRRKREGTEEASLFSKPERRILSITARTRDWIICLATFVELPAARTVECAGTLPCDAIQAISPIVVDPDDEKEPQSHNEEAGNYKFEGKLCHQIGICVGSRPRKKMGLCRKNLNNKKAPARQVLFDKLN